MFKTKSKLLFTLAVVASFAVAYIIYVSYEKSLSLTEVLVAKKTIEARTVLSGDMFEVKTIPETAKHPKALGPNMAQKVVGQAAASVIWEGEMILAPAVGLEDGEGKTTLRNENARFFPIALDKPNVTAGNIKKGDLVDIVANFKKDSLIPINSTATILNLVEVDNVVNGADGKQTLVLVVHPQDAEYLSYALMLGEITLSKAERGCKSVRTTGIISGTFLNRYFPEVLQRLAGQQH